MLSKVRNIFIFLLFVFLSDPSSCNERYLYIGNSVDGSNYYLDVTSIYNLNNEIVRYWLKVIVSEEGRQGIISRQRDKEVKKQMAKLVESKYFMEMNILQRESRIVQIVDLSSRGDVIAVDDCRYSKWTYIPPDSLLEAIFMTIQKIGQ